MAEGEYPDRDAQLFYELVRDRHASQTAHLDALDTKIAVLWSSSTALVGILLAVYALRSDAFEPLAVVFLVLSALASAGLFVMALRALWKSAWRSGPCIPFVFDLHFSEDERRLKWWLANAYWHDLSKNAESVARKLNALTWVSRLLVIQTALLALALLLVAS